MQAQQKNVLWNREGTGKDQAKEQEWVDRYLSPGICEIFSMPTQLSVGVGRNERGVSAAYEPREVELVYYVYENGKGEKITIPAS